MPPRSGSIPYPWPQVSPDETNDVAAGWIGAVRRSAAPAGYAGRPAARTRGWRRNSRPGASPSRVRRAARGRHPAAPTDPGPTGAGDRCWSAARAAVRVRGPGPTGWRSWWSRRRSEPARRARARRVRRTGAESSAEAMRAVRRRPRSPASTAVRRSRRITFPHGAAGHVGSGTGTDASENNGGPDRPGWPQPAAIRVSALRTTRRVGTWSTSAAGWP